MNRERSTLSMCDCSARVGIIESYAVGGAMAYLFRDEPEETYDLDVFVLVEPNDPDTLLGTVFPFLAARGCAVDGAYLSLGPLPIQPLLVTNPLVAEAVRQAEPLPYGDGVVRVMRMEHLMAIMLQVNRPKDRVRLARALASGRQRHDHFVDIVQRHGLLKRWLRFEALVSDDDES